LLLLCLNFSSQRLRNTFNLLHTILVAPNVCYRVIFEWKKPEYLEWSHLSDLVTTPHTLQLCSCRWYRCSHICSGTVYWLNKQLLWRYSPLYIILTDLQKVSIRSTSQTTKSNLQWKITIYVSMYCLKVHQIDILVCCSASLILPVVCLYTSSPTFLL